MKVLTRQVPPLPDEDYESGAVWDKVEALKMIDRMMCSIYVRATRECEKYLERTQKELQGIACIPFEPNPKERDQICRSRSFGEECTTLEPIAAALAKHVEEAVALLRKQKCLAGAVSVFVLTNHFKPEAPQYTIYDERPLTVPTSNLSELTKVALGILKKHFRPGYGYKKAGVVLTVYHGGWLSSRIFLPRNRRRLMNGGSGCSRPWMIWLKNSGRRLSRRLPRNFLRQQT